SPCDSDHVRRSVDPWRQPGRRVLRPNEPAIDSAIPISTCSAAEPGVVSLAWRCGILADTKSRLRSLGMRQNPSLSSLLKATRRLSGEVWRPAGCLAKRLRRIESP